MTMPPESTTDQAGKLQIFMQWSCLRPNALFNVTGVPVSFAIAFSENCYG
jgi:hypothetical protein